MLISVFGCGYLGAVHAACMATLGHEVLGVDVDEAKVAALSAGQAPFYEPGFDEVLAAALDSGRLRFSTSPTTQELADIDVHFIAVGTPQSATGAADLSYVHAAVDRLAPAVRPDAVVVGKSTVPVGTARQLAQRLDAALVWNPEFLREGFAVQDTLHPDRIVYGLPDDAALAQQGQALLDAAYADLLSEGIPHIVTGYETAELVKVAANSFLATKISFINAMAELCDATGADVTALADALGHDTRIGRRFLGAGIGFGGGCLPKDIRAFVARAEELGVGEAVSFLKQVDAINQQRRDKVVALAGEELGQVSGSRITVLGAAFKPGSDDIRDSPALEVASRLQQLGAQVRITDPKALPAATASFPELVAVSDTTAALRDADLVLLLTQWDEYVGLDPAHTATLVARPAIIDGRNALDASAWRAAGWTYRGLGR